MASPFGPLLAVTQLRVKCRLLYVNLIVYLYVIRYELSTRYIQFTIYRKLQITAVDTVNSFCEQQPNDYRYT